MDQFIQQDPFGSDQDEWDWFDLSLGIHPPPTDVPCHVSWTAMPENEWIVI